MGKPGSAPYRNKIKVARITTGRLSAREVGAASLGRASGGKSWRRAQIEVTVSPRGAGSSAG
jgi:hypothetical protein